MGNGISSAITNSWVASNQRRITKWLDNATEESVLDSFTSSFFPAGKAWALPAAQDAIPYIKETFSAYGSIDPVDGKRYWYEKDFEIFLSNRLGGFEMNASIPLLWRCFHFHSYFPFAKGVCRLDYSAFQRAIGLLAAEGNLRLGDNADGITMDRDRYPDANARASKRLWILFKSLSTTPLLGQFRSTESSMVDLSTTEDDLMDVLALTQPDNPSIMPAPIEELRPHAKRILGSSTFQKYYSIPYGDLLSLLKLMLSIQIDKPEWGSHQPYFNTGSILLPPNPDILQRAADAILSSFTYGGTADIEWHEFNNILSVYLPGFLSKFRHIFTSFLSPLTATNRALITSSPNSTLPIPHAQYLQLFLHPPPAHPTSHVFEDFARQKADHALQTTQCAYSAAPPTLNTTDLTAALSPIKTGTLLLITGEAQLRESQAVTRVIVGACMPTPWDLERQRSFRASPPQKLHTYTPDHVLFQLEPCQKILRPQKDAWIMDLIHIINSDTESRRKGGLQFGAENGNGLFVDFDNGTATLKHFHAPENEKDQSKQTVKPSTHSSAYHSISPPAQVSTDWETRIEIRKLQIYDLGGHPTPPFEEQPVPKPQLRTVSSEPQIITTGTTPAAKVSELEVGEEELKKRIMGFGPDR